MLIAELLHIYEFLKEKVRDEYFGISCSQIKDLWHLK